MDSLINYNIVIIGGDHHNGLGLARIFGINGKKVISIVIGSCKKSFLRYSKYVSISKCFENDNDALDYILCNYERNNTIIIPYSDGAAFALDERLDDFSGYIVPSINSKKGELSKMMVKSNQTNFAKRHAIKIATTEEIIFDKKKDVWNINIFPCIIKPVISAEGSKKDITICNDRLELEKAMDQYQKKGYKRALLQEYLNVDYEIDVFGCIIDSSPYIYMIPSKTIRSWPVKGGTNSYSQIITDKKIINKCYNIINKLRESGFRGLYDIELFVIQDDIYLNEINYRNSGDVYMGIKQGFYYPIYWVNDVLHIKNPQLNYPKRDSFVMTECADFRNVLKKHIKFKKWLCDYKKCEDYALKFSGDMKPAYMRYLSYIFKFFTFKKF